MSWFWQSLWYHTMQSVNHIIFNIKKYSCKGTGFIPASYRPCPRCGGEGKGILRDCRLCDDLCYVTEPWVQCQVCFGSGRQGHLGDLSPDCTACRGVGFVKPGFGMGVGVPTFGAPMGGPGMYPPVGGFGPGPAYGAVPPYGGYGPAYIPPY